MIRHLAPLALACALLGCRTAAYEPAAVAVPAGLEPAQVEVAVLAALADQPIPPGLAIDEDMGERAAQALYGWQPAYTPRNPRMWALDRRDPGLVSASLTWRRHVLRVALRYDTERVEAHLRPSDHLRHRGREIHRGAIVRIDRLLATLRQRLQEMAAYHRTPAPL